MSEWQPIETAPKDGTWVLTYGALVVYPTDGEPGALTHVMRWQAGELGHFAGWYYSGDPLGGHEPSHWVPLPAPPKKE